MKKLIYNNINYVRLIIFMLIGAFITYLIYKNSHFRYSSLDDFYVGATLYDNFNKSIDKYLPYLYTAITLFLYFINFEYIGISIYNKLNKYNFNDNDKKHKFLLSSLGIGIIFLFSYYAIGNITVPTDNYHFGEQLVGNWLIAENGYKLYSDFYPVHGIVDIIPSWIGAHILNDTSVYGVILGSHILHYSLIAITSLLAFSTLPFWIAFLGILLIIPTAYTGSMLSAISFLSLIFIITNKSLKNNFILYTTIICLSSYILYMLTPTFGAPYILSLIIPFIYRFKKYCESTSKYHCLYFILGFILLNSIILFLFRNFFLNNFLFILTNFKANLLSFGVHGHFTLMTIFIKSAQYILLPLFIIHLIQELKKQDKNIDRIMLLFVLIIYPFFIASYSLGRLDWDSFPRSYAVAYPILLFVIPMLLCEEKYKKLYSIYLITLIILCTPLIFKNTVNIFSASKYRVEKTEDNIISTPYRNGKADFDADHLDKLNNIYNFITMNAPENYSFLDLTNQGALYYYLNKKPLIPYIAYYNIPSPSQDKKCAEKLKENLPDIVLIKGYNIMHDNLPVSLRANAIYKTLLLSNKYIVLNNSDITILKKVNFHNFTASEIVLLEDALGFQNIQKLTDIYGTSLKKLSKNLEKLDIPYEILKQGNVYTIQFAKAINGKDLNYLYLKTDNKALNLEVLINDESIYIDSLKRTRLIPLDIHPKTLLNPIHKVKITFSDDSSIEDLSFYKRGF